MNTYLSTVLILALPSLIVLALQSVPSLTHVKLSTAFTPFLLVLLAIILAELVTSFLDPTLGLLLHAGILGGLLIVSTLRSPAPSMGQLLLSLTLAPLIRIISLSLPLAAFPQYAWYLIASIPIIAAIVMLVRVQSISLRDIGLYPEKPWLQALIALTGIPFGFTEYVILEPAPLLLEVNLANYILLAIALIVSTGFVEEIAFRGVMQHHAMATSGTLGVIGVAVLFAALHIGWINLFDILFVFIIGLFFSYIRHKTGSIIGASLSHGLTNIMLFLIMPALSG